MDLTQSFDEPAGQSTTQHLLTDVSYEVESMGHRIDTPVFHIRARNADGGIRDVEVEGFRPHFGLEQSDFIENAFDICMDRRVLGAVVDCSPELWADELDLDNADELSPEQVAGWLSDNAGGDVYHEPDPKLTLHDDPVATVYTRTPGDVSGQDGIRSDLDCVTYEADVPFNRRFLIDSEIYNGFEVEDGPDRVRYENWPGETDGELQQDLSPCDPPDTDARMVVYDIEVEVGDDGFPSVEHAPKPITSISAWDSYEQTYKLFGLAHDEWEGNKDEIETEVVDEVGDRFGLDPDVEIFYNETQMVEAFHQWVLSCNPDIFTGYNADGFDTPYLIQRSYNIQALSIKQYTKNGYPGTWVEEYNDERQVNFSMSGIVTLDILQAYRKTQFRELPDHTLDSVAEAELGFGKSGLEGDELDEAWIENPVEFFVYSVRDAQATVGVEGESGLMDLFENLRRVTGAPYETAVSNGPMLDTLFLRRAWEQGLILPSNTKPDEDVYHGAKVFDTVAGKHRNSVYPDLSSLYPNLFAMLNLGSETIVGSYAELQTSEYTEEDCFEFPVDERDFAIVPTGGSYDHIDRSEYKGVKSEKGSIREMFEPQYDWFYVLKPEIKTSFMQGTVDELIDLKNLYSGQMYSAVKRVVNSVYGVAGDSASGGLGFRLYNRRVAEGITLAGRLTITHTADEFTGYINDNYDESAILVGGDTDSSVTSMPGAPTLEHVYDWSMEAVEYVDNSYDQFVQDTFGFAPGDEHRLAVELESVASALFFTQDSVEHKYRAGEDGYLISETHTDAVKKRYAQNIVWDDDDGWVDTADPEDGYEDALTDPEDRSDLKKEETVDYDTFNGGVLNGMDPTSNIDITGFEYVRSDSAKITRDSQLQILTDILLSDTPEDRIETYLQQLVGDIESGDVPLEDMGRPKGIGNPLDEYGWKDADEMNEEDVTEEIEANGGYYRQTSGPWARGAKYVTDWFPWEELGAGSKPMKIPIEKVRGDTYPHAYEYHSFPRDDRPDPIEIDRPVDAIAVQSPGRVPDDFVIDTDAIIEKELKGKLEGILATMDMDWDDTLSETSQVGLGAFG